MEIPNPPLNPEKKTPLEKIFGKYPLETHNSLENYIRAGKKFHGKPAFPNAQTLQTLEVPQTRFSNKNQEITIPPQATVEEVLEKIYNHFHSPITLKEIQEISKDPEGKTALDALKAPQTARRYELLGGLCHLDALYKTDENRWELGMGT
jgi:hypothetical protein